MWEAAGSDLLQTPAILTEAFRDFPQTIQEICQGSASHQAMTTSLNILPSSLITLQLQAT
jgi:hypothetical protein